MMVVVVSLVLRWVAAVGVGNGGGGAGGARRAGGAGGAGSAAGAVKGRTARP